MREIIANLNAPPRTAEELKNTSKTNLNSIVEVSYQDSMIQKEHYPQTMRTYRDIVNGIEEVE
jgi:hypothetical protein